MRHLFANLLLCLLVIAWFLLIATMCFGAPAPLPRCSRPITAEELAGTWTLHWGSLVHPCTLGSGGSYDGYHPGSDYQCGWIGTWHWDGCTLTVIEQGIAHRSCPSYPFEWRAKALRRTRDGFAGVLESGAEFRLVRPARLAESSLAR